MFVGARSLVPAVAAHVILGRPIPFRGPGGSPPVPRWDGSVRSVGPVTPRPCCSASTAARAAGPTMAERLTAEFDAWFAKLQALTDCVLVPEDWTGRWYDGFTPADALAEGPEED